MTRSLLGVPWSTGNLWPILAFSLSAFILVVLSTYWGVLYHIE